MKPRDLAIVAAVILLGGFAVADALRSGGEDSSAPATQSVPERRDGPEPQADAPEEWPAGRLRGTLVFTDARDCRVRVIGLGGGRERPTGELFGSCVLWAAPIGQRIAYGTGGARGSAGESFTIVDLRRAGIELGTFQKLAGDVLWSPDAQRVAWCTVNGAGQEFAIGDQRPRTLARCPVAYAPDGRLMFVFGRRLVSGGRTILTERRPITQVHWGDDGSLLVVLGGGLARRYEKGEVHSIDLFTDSELEPSPDNCGVSYFDAGRIRVDGFECFGSSVPIEFIGLDAALSSDGRWVAVAAPDRIEFHQIIGGDERIVWPARARELSWRG